MIIKSCILSMGLTCIISSCTSFPKLEEAAPLDDPTAEFTKFLTSKELDDIPYRSSEKTQLFNEAQLASMRRRSDKLRNQILTDN